MRKMEIKDAAIMRIALQQEILRSEESRYDHRLHGVLLVCSGLSCGEVAEMFGRPWMGGISVKPFPKGGIPLGDGISIPSHSSAILSGT